ncbi:RDD family protein [Psychroflexus gondwanensis]|jgi:uncharacterized RDD family membrane protein YckC|uniref:RDD family protein n=1 Tax=Psychroflexus gondwanensis TaxID=251 RepID=UPI0011BE318F|nr:RDD family protein [Psychroflexus gondwanensis]TXE17002.1 RDD family protein [Psychroflexus gondwanensis]
MENEFMKAMSERTDEQLIKIVTAERDKYNPTAIDAAEFEITKRNIDTNKFEEIREKATTERVAKKEVNSGIVSSGKRFLNFIIDFFACMIGASILGFIISFFINISEGLFLLLFSQLLFLGTYFAYYAIMEIKFQKTVGKFLTKTKVVKMDGTTPENSEIIMRTFCRFIPFDRVTFLFMKNGIHDFLSKTTVIKDNIRESADAKNAYI